MLKQEKKWVEAKTADINIIKKNIIYEEKNTRNKKEKSK